MSNLGLEVLQDIEKAVIALRKGGVIIYPSDTIWGIGCDATNNKAVAKIFRIKRRHKSKSMIILLDSADKLSEYLDNIPPIALDLINQVDSPLTMIFQKPKNLAKKTLAPDGSIAIRIPKDDYCNELCRQFGKPVVSSSANISGLGNPLLFKDISPELIEKADYVSTYHRDTISYIKPSTIIKLVDNFKYEIIRD